MFTKNNFIIDKNYQPSYTKNHIIRCDNVGGII
jgi:hypothetical protein